MPKLMCIVPANYEELEAKGVASHILQRDLDGYWDKVITVHPFCKRGRVIRLSEMHTVVEYRFGDPLIIPKLYRLIKKEKVATIKAHDPHFTGVLGLTLSRLCRLPYVVMICSSYEIMREEYGKSQLWFSWLDRLVAKTTMFRADAVFGGSADAGRWATDGGAKQVFLVRTGGVADAHFALPESRPRWQGTTSNKIVLFVGRLDAVKFPEDAFLAYERIRQSHPDSVLVVAGDGPLREYLADKYHHLSDHTSFLGFVGPTQLASLMSSADVALVPLGGSALVELSLAEVPIVAYDVDWHSELIHDGSGVLTPHRDWRAMADEASKLLTSKDQAKAIGRTARQTALAQHGLRVVQDQERLCFNKILARRKQCPLHK